MAHVNPPNDQQQYHHQPSNISHPDRQQQRPTQDTPPTHKSSVTKEWDINDTHVPHILPGEFCAFDEWTDGHQRCVYPAESDEARKHTSGWAMRNTNNHNVNILKKSCLGVLVCSLGCRTANGDSVHLRPAICDKARRKQQGKLCPNRACKGGRLEVRQCRGHCGYPVTHFWRHVDGAIFFQSKGVHDHLRPDPKNSAESRRALGHHVRKPRSIVHDVAVCKKEFTLKRKPKANIALHQFMRPPPLIPDTKNASTSSTCTECLSMYCTCRLSGQSETIGLSQHYDYDHLDQQVHQPMEYMSSLPQTWHHQSSCAQPPTEQTNRIDGNFQSDYSHMHNRHNSSYETNTNYSTATPMTYHPSNQAYHNDLFDPGQIFQLDQPIRRNSSSTAGGGCQSHTMQQQHPMENVSPPTLLDMGSGHIANKNIDSIFGNLNEDSTTSSHTNNNDCSECVYPTATTGSFHSSFSASAQLPNECNNDSINYDCEQQPAGVESSNILLEFQTASYKLHKGRFNVLAIGDQADIVASNHQHYLDGQQAGTQPPTAIIEGGAFDDRTFDHLSAHPSSCGSRMPSVVQTAYAAHPDGNARTSECCSSYYRNDTKSGGRMDFAWEPSFPTVSVNHS